MLKLSIVLYVANLYVSRLVGIVTRQVLTPSRSLEEFVPYCYNLLNYLKLRYLGLIYILVEKL